MAYRLKAGRPLAKSLRRAGLEQIERASGELGGNADPHAGVHQARKALKRLRALLALMRPIIGERAYAREDRRYRRLGQSLGGVRDIQAMLDTLHKLEAHSPPAACNRAGAALGEQLRRERSLAEESLNGGRAAAGCSALAKARRRFGDLSLDGATLRGLGAGLEAIYRAGRRSFARAYATGEDDDFHAWRKATQRHWRHLQLVAEAWPEALQPRIRLAQELSQLLGDDHDLAVLRQRVENGGEALASEADVAAFLGLCTERQAELRRLARSRGVRLFGERPKTFRRRISNYWRTAPEIIPLTDVIVDTEGEPAPAGQQPAGVTGGARGGKGKMAGRGRVVPLRRK